MPVVDVIYCKDCQHYIRKSNVGNDIIGMCEMHGGMYMFGLDYCSYGSDIRIVFASLKTKETKERSEDATN